MYLKAIRIYGMCLALSLILPLVACAQEHRHSRSGGEILVTNDTDTQITYYITTEKYGKAQWTRPPGDSVYPTMNGIRIRVRGDDQIEIGDWGKAYIEDVAEFHDGAWKLSIRQARRELRHNK